MSRAPENQLLDKSKLAGPVPNEIVVYVKRAIEEGDKLPNPATLGSRPPVLRRALIIAPQYKEPGQTYAALPSTATDVKLVHEMLLESGYKPHNIRILCDVCKGFNGLADPTKENILSSLEWLVRDTYPGDYRFLHFSGHGDRLLSDSLRGKEARLVKMDPTLVVPGDYELFGPQESPQRVREQTIPIKELVYYNEAIVARVSEARDDEDQDPQHAAKICDGELNKWLSQLPENSTVTCIMDCCASGRILNLSTKLLGAGWRGRPNQPMNNAQLLVPDATESGGTNLNCQGTGSSLPPAFATFTSALNNIIPRIVRSTHITMLEEIPVRERNMDGIQARIFAWSACHQRQRAWDSSECQVGLLTSSFVQTWNRLARTSESPNSFTYNQLFEEVSRTVSKARVASIQPVPQFVQLWTSLKGIDKSLEDRLLDSSVTL